MKQPLCTVYYHREVLTNQPFPTIVCMYVCMYVCMHINHSSSHRDEHVSRRGSRPFRVGTLCLTKLPLARLGLRRV